MRTFSQFLIEDAQSPLNQQIEYYETTLSYLVNEGYADSYEEAEDIYLNLDEASKNKLSKQVGKLAWKATKAGAKLALKGVKAATKAVRDYGSYYPVGSKRRAVSDTIDKVHQATLSDAEKRKRRNAVHRARNTRQGREELAARQKKSQEVSDRWHEQQRKRQERIRARTGRYRNVGAGSRESVNEMKTFSEFIVEAEKRIIGSTRYHGTTKSRADSIKTGGFKGGKGILGFGVYSTPSKKNAEYHAKRQSADSDDKPEVIQLRSFRTKTKKHHIHGRNMYDRLPSKDPIKRDVSKRIEDRAQAHLKKGKDVTVTNLTDKQGKPIGKEVIQTPERATKDIVHNPSPLIRKKTK